MGTLKVKTYAIRTLAFVMAAGMLGSVLINLFFGHRAYAACSGARGGFDNLMLPYANTASATRYQYGGYYFRPATSQIKGIMLDQAATFMENMSTISGAYYDEATNRVVFVGKKNTSSPVLNKDDFAVAVRSLVFNNTIPTVGIGTTWTGTEPTMNVVFTGGIENTNFGRVLEDADYVLKQSFLGYQPNQQPFSTSVSSYRSAAQRYLDTHPGAGPGYSQMSSFRIVPKDMVLKRDDNTDSFTFSEASMQVQQTPEQANNTAAWNNAVAAWAQDLSSNYDAYAQGIPTWKKTKELAKVVAVVKWLKDNNIATDYTWAKNYTPTVVPTDTSLPTITTPQIPDGQYLYTFRGGVNFYQANSYVADDGSATALRSTSQAAAPAPESNHWEFTQSGQTYVSVSVSAEAFQSVGGYSTQAQDLVVPTVGENDLSLTRYYNSFSTTAQDMGRGWSWTPAQLTNIQPFNEVSCSPAGGYSGTYPRRIAFSTASGNYETYTYNCGTGYVPDKPYFHSQLVRNQDGSYSVYAKDKSYFKFSIGLAPLMHKDKNNNGVYYQYPNGSSYISGITDDDNHALTITRDAQNRVASVKDWTNRTVAYGYNAQGDLATVTDPKNGVVRYGYDSAGRLTTITDRLNNVTLTNTYDTSGKVTTAVSNGGATVTNTYNDVARTITTTDTNQRTTVTYYDDKARITRQTDALGNNIYFTYGTEPQPLTATDGRGNVTTYTYDQAGNVASITYPGGKQVTYQYNSYNQVTQSSDNRYGATPKVITYSYNANGSLTSKTEDGVTLNYTRDSDGTLLSSTDGRGNATTFTYNAFGLPVTATDAMGATSTTVYDGLGRVTAKTDPFGNGESFTYDANNNVLTVAKSARVTTNTYNAENQLTQTVSPDGRTTQFAYNASGTQSGTTDALTHLTSYGYDQYKNLTSRQDALNHTTQYAYDKLNRIKQSTTPLGKIKKWEYDANGNISKTIDESNRETTYTYDSLNRLTQTTYPDASTAGFTYDNRGNLTQMVDASGTSTFTYDLRDRMTSETDANGSSINYTYDNADNVTQVVYPGSKNVLYVYDIANRLRSVTDWNGKTTTYTYLRDGSLQSKMLPNGVLAEYTYNTAHELAQLRYTKDQKLIRQFDYSRNNTGQVTSENELWLTGNWNYDIYGDALHDGWSTSWSWNSDVNTADTSAPASGTNNIAWKANSAWAGLHLRSTTGTIDTSPYNAISFMLKGSQANQNVAVHLKDPSDNNMSTAVNLSRYGHPVSSGYTQYVIPLAAFNASATQISGLTIEDYTGTAQPNMYIDSIKLTRDSLTPMTLYGDGVPANFVRWSWNGTINEADASQPFTGSNALGMTGTSGYTGVQFHNWDGFTTKGYDKLRFALKGSQPGQNYTVQVTNTSGAGLAAELDIAQYATRVDAAGYTYYAIPLTSVGASNVMAYGFILQSQNSSAQPKVLLDSVQITGPQPTLGHDTSLFTYDNLGRLTQAQLPGRTDTYTYDAVGNMTSATRAGTTTTYANNNDNQLTSAGSKTYVYDNQGNRTGDGTTSYTYGFLNELKSLSTGGNSTVYVYDANGRRLTKNQNGTAKERYVTSGLGDISKLLMTKDIQQNTDNYYVYGDALLSQGGTNTNDRTYYLTDGAGNIRMVSNAAGLVTQTAAYDSFGNVINSTVTGGAGYQGEQFDPSNGLIYLRARYYDPATGRFMSKDPVAGTLANPQTQNGYSYVSNDPINMADPSGEIAIVPALVWAGGAILTAFTVRDIVVDIQSCDYSSAAFNGFTLLPIGRVGKYAEQIAKGHAFEKHISEFSGLGIKTQDQFASHIDDVIKNPSDVKPLELGRTGYWDDKTGTVVITDPGRIDGGTAFRPSDGKYYFDNVLK